MSVLRLLILVQILSLVQAQTVVQVHLGQSEVLNCSVKVDKTFWFMEVQGRHICICRSHGDKLKEFYIWTHFEKFSLEGNSLIIYNISEDDLTTYSCASVKDKQKSFGFHEVFEEKERYKLTTVASTPAPKESNVTPTPTPTPTTPTQNTEQCEIYKVLLFSLVGLNVIIIIIIIIITGVFFCLKRNRPKRGLQIRQTLTQYEEIPFRPNPRPSPRPGPRPGPGPAPSPGARPRAKVRSHPPEEIYSEAQMPQTTNPLYRL